MFVSCVYCVGSGLCCELITRSEEFCRVCMRVCVCLRDLETSTMRRPFGLLRHRKYACYLAIVYRPIVPM